MADFNVVADCLCGLASELYEFMTPEQIKELTDYESILWREVREMVNRKKVDLLVFIRFERFLSMIEHQSGLGMPTKKSRKDSIGDME